ncbi:MAG TPA: hypothetical protein VHC94_11590 [Nitrobacter sp.]|nr:hypothetical protein [Nitrobacter sp.]
MQDRSVIDFRRYQQARQLAAKTGLKTKAGLEASPAPRCCRHCGAALLDGESDDDCSTAGLNVPVLREPPRRFYAE